MNIFIDIDDTLFQTSKFTHDSTVFHILQAEIEAPLFDKVKETLEQMSKMGNKCFAITKRGLISNDEISITKQRLKETGLITKEQPSPLLGVVTCAKNKYIGIQKVYKDFFNTNIDKSNSILIDDDISQVAECAANGITSILFTPDMENYSKGEKDIVKNLNILVVCSWDEVKNIVKNKLIKTKEKE